MTEAAQNAEAMASAMDNMSPEQQKEAMEQGMRFAKDFPQLAMMGSLMFQSILAVNKKYIAPELDKIDAGMATLGFNQTIIYEILMQKMGLTEEDIKEFSTIVTAKMNADAVAQGSTEDEPPASE